MASWEPFVVAGFAPVVVWLLWRVQTWSVEGLRWSLLRVARHKDLRWIYATVSWFGVLVHEMSHASVLLLSGHGVRDFSVKVERGFVTPSRMKRGPVSFLFFLVAALAPLFVPPVLFLAGVWWISASNPATFPVPASELGLDGAIASLRAMVVDLPRALATAIVGLDLARWPHLLVLALALIGMPSARPSHVKGSRFHGEDDQGDIAVLRSRIRDNPWPLLAFIVVLYGAYFALRDVAPAVYWVALEAVWAVAIAGVVLAVFGSLWWALWWLGGRAKPIVNLLGPVAFVAAQVLLRRGDAMDVAWINLWSVACWAAVALVTAVVLPRRTLRIP